MGGLEAPELDSNLAHETAEEASEVLTLMVLETERNLMIAKYK